jgi:deoxyribodipyrimidine photo-lyase
MRILFWFRRDLRLEDNTGLSEASRDAASDVVPFYASDPAVLDSETMAPARMRFALDSLADLASEAERAGSRLLLDHGDPVDVVPAAAARVEADAVYWNEVHEPALRAQDEAVEQALRARGVAVKRFHDRLLVPPDQVLTAAGTPYVVYTPFRAACERLPLPRPIPGVPRLAAHAFTGRTLATPERLRAPAGETAWPGGAAAAKRRLERFLAEALEGYGEQRDHPARLGTSRLSADLKFGTLSPRTVVAAVMDHVERGARPAPAGAGAAPASRLAAWEAKRAAARAGGSASTRASANKFVAELRWRDFYSYVLHHFPHVERGAFRRELDAIVWPGEVDHFVAWKSGQTGFPLVDAGMRQLLLESWMHNRVRMIVASFLTKHLLLDWRRGERHFMRHLIDGDLANNNGGWQWVASTGTDPQPYFRAFNPTLQGERFDAEGDYVRRWVPELARVPAQWIHKPWEAPGDVLAMAGVRLGQHYPRPIVDFREQRERALALYKNARP